MRKNQQNWSLIGLILSGGHALTNGRGVVLEIFGNGREREHLSAEICV